jgi:hypothetical protein
MRYQSDETPFDRGEKRKTVNTNINETVGPDISLLQTTSQYIDLRDLLSDLCY